MKGSRNTRRGVGLRSSHILQRNKVNRRLDLRLKTLQQVREIGHRYPWVDVNGVSKAGDLDFVMERVDLFRCEPPPEVAAISEFVWMPLPGEGYRLLLSEKRQFVAARNLLGRWELRFIAGREEHATLAAVSDELAKVVRHAERWVEEHAPDSVKLVRRDAQWRGKAATDAQLELLRRWRLPVPDGLSRGQAAWIISVADARRGTKFIGEGHERSVRQTQ